MKFGCAASRANRVGVEPNRAMIKPQMENIASISFFLS